MCDSGETNESCQRCCWLETKRFCLPRKFKVSFHGGKKWKNSEAQLVSDKDFEAAENEEALTTLQNEVLEYIQPHPRKPRGY